MKEISYTKQNKDHGGNMLLQTRVFELCKENNKNLNELSETMNISPGQLDRMHQGKYSINQKFIIGALRAFPEYNIGDLFYFTS